MRRLSRVGCSAVAAMALGLIHLTGCGREPDVLHLFFRDDVVEAPARTIDLTAVRGAECERLLKIPHDQVQGAPSEILAHRTSRYPVSPGEGLLRGLPRGEPIALDVTAHDADELQIGRACRELSFDVASSTTVDMELRSLPACSTDPTGLDVTLVLDTSDAMKAADPASSHLDALTSAILSSSELPGDTSLGIITHGHGMMVSQVLQPTTDRALATESIEALRGLNAGVPRIYDAVSVSAAQLRARSVCGRKPALLVVLGGFDDGSERPLEEAWVALIAARDDPTDDLLTEAIGLSDGAFERLKGLVPIEVGVVANATPGAEIHERLSRARERLVRSIR